MKNEKNLKVNCSMEGLKGIKIRKIEAARRTGLGGSWGMKILEREGLRGLNMVGMNGRGLIIKGKDKTANCN